MRLRITFVDYCQQGEMPNAQVVTDEYMEDAWGEIPDCYREAVAALNRESPEARFVEAFVTIPDEAVLALFAPIEIAGSVEREAGK